MCRLLIYLAVLAAGITGATGCHSDPAGPPPRFGLAVETDKPQYSLAADSVALVTLTNPSDGVVYLPMDVYVVCERLGNGEWRDAFAWFSVDGIGRSFPLSPGSAQTDVLQLWFYLPEHPGTYRFRYFVYADSDVRSLLPIEQRVSPPFVLTL
jgi:hypothetical protein